jgi:hypothetical protein
MEMNQQVNEKQATNTIVLSKAVLETVLSHAA